MGGVFSTRGREKKYIHNLVGKPEGRGAPSESMGMILKFILKKGCGGVNWINMPQGRALVSTAMNLLFPWNVENLSEQLSDWTCRT
jgi:hypothetical protein